MAIASGMRYSAAQVEEIIDELFTRHRALHNLIANEHRPHFYTAQAKNPKLGNPNDPDNPFRDVTPYQSEACRVLADKLIPRLTENHFKVVVNVPKHTARTDALADKLENVLNAGLQEIEKDLGSPLQQLLAMGQIRDAYGVLHWYPRFDHWPEPAQYEWRDELDDGEDKDFKDVSMPCMECYGMGIKDDGKKARNCGACDGMGYTLPDDAKGRYRETAAHLLERRQADRAKAGFPWRVQVMDALTVAFSHGTGGQAGFARVAVRIEMSRSEYEDAFEDEDWEDNEGDLEQAPDNQQSGGTSGSTHQAPSGADYRNRILVQQLWVAPVIRGGKILRPAEYYESVAEPGAFELRKAFKLPGRRMLPFAIAPAIEKFHPDPAWRYEPYLKSVYNLKPFFDQWKTYVMAITAMQAQPLLVSKRTAAVPSLSADGRPTGFGTSQNSVSSGELPPGYEMEQIKFDTTGAAMKALEMLIQEFNEALPATGQAELSTNTQPWTARIGIQQATVSPAMLLRNGDGAIRAMAQDMAYTHSIEKVEDGGFGEPLTMYGRVEGKIDRSKVLVIHPKDITTLDVDVETNATGQGERVALTEHLAGLVDRGKLLERDYIADGLGKENPQDYSTQLKVERATAPYEIAYIQQQVAAMAGTMLTMGVNGEIVGPGGQPVDPSQVLAQNGYRPAGGPSGAPGPGSAGGAQAVPPALPTLQTPNTTPLPGVPATGAM